MDELLEVISATSGDAKTRLTALHALRELINSDAPIVATRSPTLVNRLIDVQLAESDLALIKAIEECTTALARIVDVKILLPILKNIIRAPEQAERKSAAAIKILSNLIHQQTESDARELVEGIVPLVFQVCNFLSTLSTLYLCCRSMNGAPRAPCVATASFV